MSMYHIVFGGCRPAAGLVLKLLDREQGWFRRFRDAWIEVDGEGTISLAVYTRNGGGNRECWNEAPEGCTCPGCTIGKIIPTHPLYIRDRDDDFDRTYATIYFRAPDDANEQLRKLGFPAEIHLIDLACEPVDMSAVWQKAIADFEQAVDKAKRAESSEAKPAKERSN